MRTIDADDAKAEFDALLADVSLGETVVVTRKGVAIARIVPVREQVIFENAAAAIESWRRYRDEHNIRLGGGISIKELIEEGRE